MPAVVDLAAMRNAMQALGGDAEKINPLVPVDLVIDHSVIVNFFGDNKAFAKNVVEEYKQNQERYEFLKWGQNAFSNFSVVPPGTGICHQVNLEYLAQTVWTQQGEDDGRQEDRHVRGRLSGFAGRHRLAHHHGQRPCRARLGRRRHRGGSRDARPAAVDAAAGSGRLQAEGPAQGRRHRDRSRADGDADAAQAGRGRKIRRVLRPRPRLSLGRGQGDHRQHGAGIWRDLRLLPGRCRDHRLSQDLGPQGRPRRAGEGLCQGAGPVPHRQVARSGVHGNADARSRRRRALDGRPEASRRPRRAACGRGRFRGRDGQRIQEGRAKPRSAMRSRTAISISAMATW